MVRRIRCIREFSRDKSPGLSKNFEVCQKKSRLIEITAKMTKRDHVGDLEVIKECTSIIVTISSYKSI